MLTSGTAAGPGPPRDSGPGAAETGDAAGSVLDHGREKAVRKGADLLVVNEVGDGRGFGSTETSVSVLDSAGNVLKQAAGAKETGSELHWDRVAERLR